MNVRLLILATVLAGLFIHPRVGLGFSAPVVVRTSGTLFQAASGKGSNLPDICGIPGGAPVWYQFKTNCDGTLLVDTEGSKFDTLLGVFVDDGSDQGLSSLIQIACDDDSGSNGLSSALRTEVTNGVPYYIMLEGKNGAYGHFILSYSFDHAPFISPIGQQTVREEQSVIVPFVVSDKETAPAQLQLFAECDDTNLVPNSAFVFAGAGTNRTVKITPSAHCYGTNTITISVCDSIGNVRSSSFRLNVRKVNHNPIASDITYTRLPGKPISISVPALMRNASDFDNDKLTLISVSPRSRANAAIIKSATFVTYTVPYNYNSVDRFTYTVIDCNGATAMGTITINVSASDGKSLIY